MIDFIPLVDYTPFFDYSILILVLIAFWQCNTGIILHKNIVSMNAVWGVLFTVLLIFYMGLRPISSYFGDTVNYANVFFNIQRSSEPFVWKWGTDCVFYNLHAWFAKFSDIHTFFLLCAFIYVGSLWLAMQRIFKSYYYIPLLVVFSMFTFWAYGVNGVRNGMGASLFILAVTYINRLPVAIILCILSVGIHKSCLLLVGAAFIAWFIKNSYIYLLVWIGCVGISYTVGMRIQNYIVATGILGEDDRLTDYLTGSGQIGEIIQMSMTFRWDFLIYSAMGVFVGYYFIFRRNFRDEYYHWLYNIFLISNAFWVLVIRAIYSNRFAQISWFIMPIILIYPFIKQRFWKNHEKILGAALLVFYAFAFYYNILK